MHLLPVGTVSFPALQSMFSSLTHTETSFRVEDNDGNLPFPLGPHLFLGPNAPDRDYSSVSWLSAGRLLWTVARRKPGSLETVGDAGDIGFFCSPSSAQTSTPYPAFTSSSEQRGHLYNTQDSVEPRTFMAALGGNCFLWKAGPLEAFLRLNPAGPVLPGPCF